jgi:hypothetical protein
LISNAAPMPGAVALVLLPALVLTLAFSLSYVGAFHDPTPHAVPVAIIGPQAAAAQLNRLAGDPLDARPTSSRPAALSEIDDRDVYRLRRSDEPPVRRLRCQPGDRDRA